MPDPPDDKHTVLAFRGTTGPVVVPDDVATHNDRVYRAYKMHLEGTSWADIAQREQWVTPVAVRAEVARYVREGAALLQEWTAKELVVLEVDRLNKLQEAVWPRAMAGDVQSVKSVLDIIRMRAKLTGLEALSDTPAAAMTVVMAGGSKEDFIDALQAAARTNGALTVADQGESVASTHAHIPSGGAHGNDQQDG